MMIGPHHAPIPPAPGQRTPGTYYPHKNFSSKKLNLRFCTTVLTCESYG